VRSSFVMSQSLCQTGPRASTTMLGGTSATRDNCAVGKNMRRVLGLGLLAGAAYAIWRQTASRSAAPVGGWEPQPFPFPPQPVPDATDPWVEPAESGACPANHPVKAKLASGIYHVPGGANYARTQADRCYLSAEAAEADGLRASKR
jgi:hypothetical protein